MSKRHLFNVAKRTSLAASVLLLAGAPIVVSGFSIHEVHAAQQLISPQALADVSILQNTSLNVDGNPHLVANSDGTYNLNLTYTGQSIASTTVNLGSTKLIVFNLPETLNGLVTGSPTITVDATLSKVLPFAMGGLNAVVTTLTTALNSLVGLVGANNPNLDALVAFINRLTEGVELSNYQATIQATTSGTAIYADFSDGLGNYVKQELHALINNLQTLVSQITVSGILATTALNVLKNAINGVITLANPIIDAGGAALNSIASASILGETKATLNATITPPAQGVESAVIHSAIVNKAFLDVNLLDINSSDAATVYFQETPSAWEAYQVATPVLNPIKTDDTDITGNVSLNAVPAGTTFQAIFTLPDLTTQIVDVAANGDFTLPANNLTSGQLYSVVIRATHPEGTKDSTSASQTVEASDVTNPLASYVVTPPTVNPLHIGATAITGKADTTDAPANTTFKVIATPMNGGTAIEAPLNADESFNLPLPSAAANGDQYNIVLQAINGTNTKNSTPVGVVVNDSNPLEFYQVKQPAVMPINDGATSLTGSLDTSGAPAGTVFSIDVTLPDGTTKTIESVTGDFSLTLTEPAKVGQTFTFTSKAKNGTFDKTADPLSVPVADPLAGYNLNLPTVNLIKAGAISLNGHFDSTGAPTGTTFKANITLPDGNTETVDVDASGNFTLPIASAKEGDSYTVKIQAINGSSTKNSLPIAAVVQPADAVDPFEGYTIPKPEVNDLGDGATSFSGTVDTASRPENVTLRVIVTRNGQAVGSATVDPATGQFSGTTITTMHGGEVYRFFTLASDGTNEKYGEGVNKTVMDAVNPLADYTVPTPTISTITAGDHQLNGQVALGAAPAGTTFKAIITLPSGAVAAVDVNPTDGTFTLPINPVAVANDTYSVQIQALNGSFTKDGEKVTTTVVEVANPLVDYTVNTPVTDPINVGDTTITGSVNMANAPAGTNFQVSVQVPGQADPVLALVSPTGTFTVPLATPATEGQTYTLTTIANNGTFVKPSSSIDVTVQNPLANYPVNAPNLNTIKEGEKQLTGSVSIAGAPADTTFKAIITLPNNTEAIVDVDSTGAFSFVLPSDAVLGDSYQVKIQATHNGLDKTGLTATTTVIAADATNPLEDVTLAKPDVNPLVAGGTIISGTAATEELPAGTTVTAIIALPDGTTERVPVTNGTFTHTLSKPAQAGENYTVTLEASNGGFSVYSPTVQVPVTNPLAGYTTVPPTFNPIKVGDTTVTGHIDMTNAPADTNFTVTITLPNGTVKTVNPDNNGNFSLPLETPVKAGDTLTAVGTATNNGFSVDSQPTRVTVSTSGETETPQNPLDDYHVAQPIVDPIRAGDTTISGRVDMSGAPTGTTFTVKVQLPDGSTVTVMPSADGKFSLALAASVEEGQKFVFTSQASNGNYLKNSDPLTVAVTAAPVINPLDDYLIALPFVDDIYADDTVVTGRIITNGAPAGTTHTVMLMLPDGTNLTATPDRNGRFTFPISAAITGQRYRVQVVAHNGSFSKTGSPLVVSAVERNNETGGGEDTPGNNNPGDNGNNGNGTSNSSGTTGTNSGTASGNTGTTSNGRGTYGTAGSTDGLLSAPFTTGATNQYGLNSDRLNRGTYPATGEQQQPWLAIIGIAMLGIAGTLGWRHRKQLALAQQRNKRSSK